MLKSTYSRAKTKTTNAGGVEACCFSSPIPHRKDGCHKSQHSIKEKGGFDKMKALALKRDPGCSRAQTKNQTPKKTNPNQNPHKKTKKETPPPRRQSGGRRAGVCITPNWRETGNSLKGSGKYNGSFQNFDMKSENDHLDISS